MGKNVIRKRTERSCRILQSLHQNQIENKLKSKYIKNPKVFWFPEPINYFKYFLPILNTRYFLFYPVIYPQVNKKENISVIVIIKYKIYFSYFFYWKVILKSSIIFDRLFIREILIGAQ